MGASFEILQRAHSLVELGREAEALALVESGIAEGNPFAAFTLADWRLRGVMGPRDPARARALFGQASDSGLPTARYFYTNLLASGVGGDADWPAALARLAAEAKLDARREAALRLIEQMDMDELGRPNRPPSEQLLCAAPRIGFFEKLFTADECAYVVAAAQAEFRPSTVVPTLGGREYLDAARDSDGSTLHWLIADPAIHALNLRIAAASSTNVDQGEPLHVLRYSLGQEFRPHHDWSEGIDNQRIKTALVALNDDYSGGETCFPEVGLKVKGRTGDAIIFRNASEDGHPDPISLHAGAPVTAGTKLIASRWIRQHRYEGDS
jgi:prolyl 4-hydroxylase